MILWVAMKKRFFLVILLALALGSCATNIKTEYTALKKLPAAYTREDAIEDGCVVFDNGDIAYGQARWDQFAASVPDGKASVRLAYYYTLENYDDEEYYESVKDEYPKLFVQDLEYDGEYYMLRWFEDGEEIIQKYKYMLRFEGDAETPYASYDSYVRYVLVNDNTVTWEELQHGIFSSQMGDYIAHHTVYTDLK